MARQLLRPEEVIARVSDNGFAPGFCRGEGSFGFNAGGIIQRIARPANESEAT